MYLPEAFQKKMKAILGEEYDDFLAGFEKPRHYGLRGNTAKITVEEFKELVPFHLTQIPWVENGFYYEEEDAPTRHPYYYAGLYYIQEPSAMTTASRLPVGPGERVLDLCAAPGGNSPPAALACSAPPNCWARMASKPPLRPVCLRAVVACCSCWRSKASNCSVLISISPPGLAFRFNPARSLPLQSNS